MKNIIIFLFLFLLSWCFSSSKNIENNDKLKENKTIKEKVSKPLITEDLEEKTVNWVSMEPLIKDGEKVFLDKKFYKKDENLEKSWDLVSYDFKWDKNPIIKKIVATDEDKVEIKNNTLFVSDIEIKNSAWDSYNFSLSEQKMMKIYIKNNKIPKNSLFILWDNINNSRDSRKFWAISSDDLFWKIILKK